MPLDFPDPPTIGDMYSGYLFDGVKWIPKPTERLETVQILSGTTPVIEPLNGTLMSWTLSADSTPTESMENGQSVTLMITAGSFIITWDSVLAPARWTGGAAPELPATGQAVITLWKVNDLVYGSHLGDVE